MPKINFEEEELYAVFIHGLVREKGLDAEDRSQHGKISHELSLELDERIEKAIIGALPLPELKKLNELVEHDASDQEIKEFFANAGVDFDAAVRQEMKNFRSEYLGNDVRVESTDQDESESVKEVAPAADTAQGTTVTLTAENTAEAMVTVSATPPAGNPAQGLTSEVQGSSDVEGVSNMTNTTSGENGELKMIAEEKMESNATDEEKMEQATVIAEEK